jgi:queuine tRNA-ribosyltransferase
MGGTRNAIMSGRFPDYLRSFFDNYFGDMGYPQWCVNALRSVGVDMLEGKNMKTVSGNWEYSDREGIHNTI